MAKKENQSEKLDFAKKFEDATADINKISETLADSASFHHKADDLYDQISKKSDYIPYIIATKTARGMLGNHSFKQLNNQNKRNVLAMIRDAIRTYITKELTDKTRGDENGKRN